MLQVTKITPFDRHLREYNNPFIAEVAAPPKPVKPKTKPPKRAPNKQTIKQPQQIELDREKGRELEGYEPLYRKLLKDHPIERRYWHQASDATHCTK